ncbi:MAG: replication-associated recombination protein A, partial [Solobacterium sp.]|nr:replication-associated recombination protein A [Solobacterium sp.]
PTSLMKDLGYGRDYVYAHDTADKLSTMQCLPDSLVGRTYYNPTEQGVEKRVKERKEQITAWKKAHLEMEKKKR